MHTRAYQTEVPASRPKNPIFWIDSRFYLERLAAELEKQAVVGLDIETTLAENPQRICTIQLATRSGNYIIDALALESLDPLRGVLESDHILKLIHYAAFETAHFNAIGIELSSIFDTCSESRRLRGRQPDGHSLKVAAARELGLVLDKHCQTSDWTLRPLSAEQLDYAALDAEVLFGLYDVFSAAASAPEKDRLAS